MYEDLEYLRQILYSENFTEQCVGEKILLKSKLAQTENQFSLETILEISVLIRLKS